MRQSILKILVFVMFIGVPLQCAPVTSIISTRPDLARQIDSYVHEMENKGFSGSILIRKNRSVILDRSYGRIRKSPMKPNERYWIASITKQFTGAAVLKLSEEGKLKLSDSIVKFFRSVATDRSFITIEHLMTHTSGIPNNYFATGIKERATAVESILRQPLAHQPGDGCLYCADTYGLGV